MNYQQLAEEFCAPACAIQQHDPDGYERWVQAVALRLEFEFNNYRKEEVRDERSAEKS